MSKLNEGEVEITLNETPRVLRPTLNAMQALSRAHGGLTGAHNGVLNRDVDIVCSVLFHGMGLKDAERKDLVKAVYKNGIPGEMQIALMRYIAILGNGGKPLEEVDDEDADHDEAGAGNA